MRLQVHPQARADLRDILRYYAGVDDEGSLADDFYQNYRDQEFLVLSNPLLFNIRAGIARRVNLKPRFGEYYIAYMIWREQVVILAIAHAKRRPYYWRHRIGEAKKMF